MEIVHQKQQPLNPPAQPAAAPAAAPEAPKKLSDQERDQLTRDTFDVMGWGATKPAAAAPAAPAAAAAAAAPSPAIPAQPTTDELIRRSAIETARQTALAVSEVLRPPVANNPAPAPEFVMNETDADDYGVIQYLESKGNPKFKGMSALFMQYVKDHYAYQEKWLTANAGKEYDMDADEHTAWYDEHMPPIDPKDIERGRIDMIADQRVEQLYQERVKPREDAADQAEAFRRGLPIIAMNVTKNIVSFTKYVDAELSKLIVDDQGKPAMSQENIDKLMLANPIAGEIMDEMVRAELEPILLELEKTTIEGMNFKLDPKNNDLHAVIDRYRRNLEKEIGEGTNQVVNGKQFVTIAKLQDMQRKAMASGTNEEKNQRLSEIDAQYWTINVDNVEEAIIKDCAERAKKQIEREEVRGRKRFGIEQPNPDKNKAAPSTSPTGAPTARPSAAAPAAAPSSGKPMAPSISSQTEVVTPGQPGSSVEKKFGEVATETMFGR